MSGFGKGVPYKGRSDVINDQDLPSKDPFAWFDIWMTAARTNPDILEAYAFCLSTASKDGIPSGRMLLLKDYSKDGFKFFSQYNSKKGEDLDENPNASITFFWDAFGRSVRIDGSVEKLPVSEADYFFHQRPYASQITSSSSNQSQPLESRKAFYAKEEEMKTKYQKGEVPRPEFWGGYVVKPKSFEFWQGQADRIHDRIKFYKPEGDTQQFSHKGEDGWFYQRLSP